MHFVTSSVAVTKDSQHSTHSIDAILKILLVLRGINGGCLHHDFECFDHASTRITISLAKVSMVSKSSCSDLSKSARSFARITVAAFKSASVVAILPARSPTLVWKISLVAPGWTQTRHQIGLLLTSRFHAKCQIVRLRLAPSSKFLVNSVSPNLRP